MLDTSTIEQLRSVFARLDSPITLKIYPSNHADQSDALALLESLVQTSPLLQLETLKNAPQERAPRFEIHRDSRFTGISFRGIPGGHEFSSLVLALLHADGKGKRPDRGIEERIQRLKGPIRLKTYMSLSCENCPDVVQALNLMATLHSDFEHEVIDGAVAPEEIDALGIQGVPSVIADEKLLHSGKSTLLDLLTKLETAFGTSAQESASQDLGHFDVLVIGGGPAGASSAIYAARKGLSVALVAERLGGQLQETKGIENMISIPYTEGVPLAAQLTDHLSKYPVKIFEHRRVRSIHNSEPGANKHVALEGGESLSAQAIIIATGAKWRELGIPGEKENLGQGVAFCAHCDGPFYKNKRVVVVGGGNSGVEAAIDLAGLASEVTLLEYHEQLKADDVLTSKLRSIPHAKIVTQAKTTRVIGDGKKVTAIEFEDRATGATKTIETDGIFVQIGLLPNTHFLKGLLELTASGEIAVDSRGRTSASGIYAAGDVTTIPFKQIITAMGDGAKVALTVFEDRLHASKSLG